MGKVEDPETHDPVGGCRPEATCCTRPELVSRLAQENLVREFH